MAAQPFQHILHLHGLEHYTIPAADDSAKEAALLAFLEHGPACEGLIFFSTRHRAAAMAAALHERAFPVDLLHRDQSPGESEAVLQRFSSGHARFLLVDAGSGAATAHTAGVRARVLINFDLPATAEAYLARMGQPGAFGRCGFAVNLALPSEATLLAAVDEQTGRAHTVVRDAAGMQALTERCTQAMAPPALNLNTV